MSLNKYLLVGGVRISFKKRLNPILVSIIITLSSFLGILAYFDSSPQGLSQYFNSDLSDDKEASADVLSEYNYGIISRLDITPKYDWGNAKNLSLFKDELLSEIIDIFSIHISNIENSKIIDLDETGEKDNLLYKKLYVQSYDNLSIPVVQFFPQDFDENNIYPTVIVFSGHGSYDDVNFEEDSYQHAAALELAKKDL